MPIRVHLDEVLADRGMTLTDLSNQIQITLANLSILKTGKARAIRFSTLEAICDALACQPGDLLTCDGDPPRGEEPAGIARGDDGSRPARFVAAHRTASVRPRTTSVAS